MELLVSNLVDLFEFGFGFRLGSKEHQHNKDILCQGVSMGVTLKHDECVKIETQDW